MKRILKHIAVAMLTLAIAFTGISLDGTMTTANAAASYTQLKDGSTVTPESVNYKLKNKRNSEN